MHLRLHLARCIPGLALTLAALVPDLAAAQDPSVPPPPPIQRPTRAPAPTPPAATPEPPAPTPEPPAPTPEPPAPTPEPPAPTPEPPAPTPEPPAPTPEPPPVAATTEPPAPTPEPAPPTITRPPPASPEPTPTTAAPPPSIVDEPTTQPATAPPVPSDSPKDDRKDPKRWRHAGFIVDLQVGTGGCTRRFCGGDSGHNAAPGARIGGFVGGNIFGILEIGLSAGWNTLRPRDVVGRNAMTLYGLDPAQVQVAIAEAMGVPALAVDLSTLTVQSATSRAFDIGPSVRVHFIRKGRGLAYVGADIHYQLWRNRYSTASGDLRLDFHGLSIPLRAGGGAYVHRNFAIVGEFSYAPTYFVVGGIHHPMLDAVAPLAALEGRAADVSSNTRSLNSGLPHLWNLTIGLRMRF